MHDSETYNLIREEIVHYSAVQVLYQKGGFLPSERIEAKIEALTVLLALMNADDAGELKAMSESDGINPPMN